MPLELIIGPANAGVTHALRARLAAHVRGGGRAMLLVPSVPDVSRATRELAAEAPLGLEIQAFDQHLDALWSVHGDGRQLVTPVQRLVVLEESGRHGPMDVLGAGERTTGLVRTMARIVQRAAESHRTSVIEPLHGAAHGLFAWLDAYEALLRRAGLVERGEAHRHVAGSSEVIGLPEFTAVEGFSGLTRAQEQYLVRRSRQHTVILGLIFDANTPATHAARALVERLRPSAQVTVLEPGQNEVLPAELARVGLLLGAPGTGDVRAEGAVLLSEAWGEESEAARIVREAQDALDGGIPAGEIAVVYRDARHVPALRLALEEAGIAAEFDLRVPLQSSGLGRALLLLLAVGGPTGTYDQLLDLLRSRYGPGTDSIMDELDARMRRGRSCDCAAATAWLRRHDRESLAFLEQARMALQETGNARSERRWYALVSAMMRRAHEGSSSAETDVMLDAAVARIFIEAVRSVNALDVGAGASTALAAALREASIALVTADRPDHIQVLSAERVRGRRYRCVIIGGLTAAEFPRRAGEDALTAPSVSRSFEMAGIDVEPRADLAAERLIFYIVATRATERLVLSWQSHNANGDPGRRSIFIEELLDLYRDSASGAYFAGEPPLRVLELEGAGLHVHGPHTTRRRLRTRAAAEGPPPNARVHEARRRSRRAADTTSDAARRLTAEREVFSASEIEAYLQCPYRWFTGSVIASKELDERFDAAAAGVMAHEILRRFYDAFAEETGLPRVTGDSLDLARMVHAQTVKSVICEPGTHAREAAAVRAVTRRTLGIIEADATLLPALVPAHREWSFGIGEDDEAESLDGFSLRGRIDRIDVGAGQLVVTDYKLGAVGAGRGVQKFAAEGLVQLPLYAAVASRRLGFAVGGGVYRSLGGGKPRGFVTEALADSQFVRTDVLDGDQMEAVLAEALDRARGAVERMRSGDIHPEPLSGSCPPYCPAAAFCAERRDGRA